MMNKNVLNSISQMYRDGKRPSAIADALGISKNTVKSHIRRHLQEPDGCTCLNCGAFVAQTKGKKAKKFCSDKCRINWWNHQYRDGGKKDA